MEQLFEDALDSLRSGKELEGRDGAVTPLIKRLLEVNLEGEIDEHLGESRPNRRNGKSSKWVKTSYGKFPSKRPVTGMVVTILSRSKVIAIMAITHADRLGLK